MMSKIEAVVQWDQEQNKRYAVTLVTIKAGSVIVATGKIGGKWSKEQSF
jgi:hypothetical protein